MSNPWEQSEPNGQNNFSGDHAVAVQIVPDPQAVVEAQPALKSNPAADESGGGNIDKIRDILFGGHMRDYDTRFARLEQTLLRESADIRENTKKLLERLESYVKQELEALNLRFKNERDERGSAVSGLSRDLKELHEALHKRIAEVDDHASGAHHDLREQLLQHGRDTSDQMEQRQREVTALLEQRFTELRKDKTDRAALASLFSEIAMRLNNDFHIPGLDH